MSSAILRRNSSKQGLQNLLRVTAQRSIEDAEEIERERRRRAREAFRSGDQALGSGAPSPDTMDESELKPSVSHGVEEDEGFSDWTQRRRQQRMEEQGSEEERDTNGEAEKISSTTSTSAWPPRPSKEQQEEEQGVGKESGRRKEWEEEEEVTVVKRREEAIHRPNTDKMVIEKRKEEKVSYTSKVFLQQDKRHNNSNGDAAGEEVTSHVIKTKRTPSRGSSQAHQPVLETEQKLEKIRRSHQEKEAQELEHLRHRQAESEQELEELKRRREERRRVRQEEECRREGEEQQRLAKEEEEKRRMKEDIERRRMVAAERRMKTLSTSSNEGDEIFSPVNPKSPAFKRENEDRLTAENSCLITERTESLNRSLKKSNSFKKTQPPVLLPRMEDKREQYTHAIEDSKAVKSALMDIASPPEAVASKKNLFEAGETWSQNMSKGTPSKDAEGIKVAVADLITQWVKGTPEGSNRNSPFRPAEKHVMLPVSQDVKAGDVLQKKNMWEIIGDASSCGTSAAGRKGSSSGKKYKFIVTGHGKYEKIPVDDDYSYTEYTNGKSTEMRNDTF